MATQLTGTAAINIGDETLTVTFPSAFTQTPQIFPGVIQKNDPGDSDPPFILAVYSVSGTGFTVKLSANALAAATFTWLATVAGTPSGTGTTITVRQGALILLRDIGVTSLSPSANQNNRNARGIGPGDLEAVCLAMNGAIEEIFDLGPAAISQQPFGEIIRKDTPITLDVTNYSATVANVTSWSDWMLGCTVRIGSDSLDNRFLSRTRLARPYTGATATTVASHVFGDALPLPSSMSHILEPVAIPGIVHLKMVNTREEFDSYAAQTLIITPRTRTSTPQSTVHNKFIGEPNIGFVDTIYDPLVMYLQKFLRVTPMPGQDYPINFTVKLKPPVVAPADIDPGDHTTDPSVGIPLEWIPSVLIPIARQRMSSDPLFGNLDGKEEILRQYKAALKVIDNQVAGRTRTQAIYR